MGDLSRCCESGGGNALGPPFGVCVGGQIWLFWGRNWVSGTWTRAYLAWALLGLGGDSEDPEDQSVGHTEASAT